MYDTSALKKKGSSVHSNFTVLVHCRENCTNNQCSSRHVQNTIEPNREFKQHDDSIFWGDTNMNSAGTVLFFFFILMS